MKQWRFKARLFGDEHPEPVYLAPDVPFVGNEVAAELELCRRMDDIEEQVRDSWVLEGWKVLVMREFGREIRV